MRLESGQSKYKAVVNTNTKLLSYQIISQTLEHEKLSNKLKEATIDNTELIFYFRLKYLTLVVFILGVILTI